MKQHRQQVRQLIEQIIKSGDVSGAMSQALSVVDEIFIQELQAMIEEARKQGDLERSSKLQQMVGGLAAGQRPARARVGGRIPGCAG